MRKPVVAVLLSRKTLDMVFDRKTLTRLRRRFALRLRDTDKVTPELAGELLRGADAAITGWGTPPLTPELLDAAPRLRLVAHSAGSVKHLVCDAIWERGIQVTTTAPAIAISVAQYTLGAIITSLARVYPLAADTHAGRWGKQITHPPQGLYGITVGLVGAGFVGRQVIGLLRQFEIEILLYDPFVSAREAAKLGVRKAGLDRLLKLSDAVSLHAPSIPQTRHMIHARNLALLKPGAILVNTARGSLIDETALIDTLRTGSLFAFLDVTDPEPPAPNSPLRTLENVVLTPHIAGKGANTRQGAMAATELERVFSGKKPVYGVTREMLARMA